jgi:zinc/manganese transport system permease protein
VAEAKGLPMLSIGVIFMLLVAFATSISVQVVGVLLIFSLMVTPAAIAQRFAKRPLQGIIISVAIALAATWAGLFIAFYEPYPVSFFITSLVFALYIIVILYQRLKENSFYIAKAKEMLQYNGHDQQSHSIRKD